MRCVPALRSPVCLGVHVPRGCTPTTRTAPGFHPHPPLYPVSPPRPQCWLLYRTAAPRVPQCFPLLLPSIPRTPLAGDPPPSLWGCTNSIITPQLPLPPLPGSPQPHLSVAAAAPCLYPCFCRNAVPHLQPPPHIQTDVAPPPPTPLTLCSPHFPLSHHPMGVGGGGGTPKLHGQSSDPPPPPIDVL